nr:MAG TPA: Minor capsid protein [Caudoviricetes sp.]
MSIGIKIELDAAAIAKLEAAALPAAAKTMEALKTDVIAAQVMPFDTGDMQNNQTFTVSGADSGDVTARLVTGAPQARRLYYHPEYNFQTVNNPNAGGEWLEPWLEGDRKDFVQDTFTELYKKEAGL